MINIILFIPNCANISQFKLSRCDLFLTPPLILNLGSCYMAACSLCVCVCVRVSVCVCVCVWAVCMCTWRGQLQLGSPQLGHGGLEVLDDQVVLQEEVLGQSDLQELHQPLHGQLHQVL